MKEKETEVILVSGGRRVAGANSKFKKKSLEYLEKQLSWKVAPRKGIRIQGSGKILQVESGILGFGICNTRPRLKSSTWNPESTAWNPESKTVLDSLTWGERKESVFYKGFLFTSEKQNMNWTQA